jgi:tetratricopeptide (TPR) repeat protein
MAHPLFASSAAWIPARGDLLLTLFSILSFIFWISFLNNKRYSVLILSWLWFTLALFTKETAALLPVLFLLYFFIFESKPKIDFKTISFGILLLCTGIVWFILRSTFINVYDTTLTVNLFLRNIQAIPAALSMFVVPYDFSTAPEFTLIKMITGFVLLVLLIVMIVMKSSHSRRKKLFYLLWFVLLLFPTFFAKTKEWDYLEHRFLLPLIGILIFLLSFIQNISKVKVAIVTSVLVIVFSTVSIFKSKGYSNPYTFCEAMRHNKNSPEAYYFLKGNIEQITENYENALKEYNTAILYNPDHIKSLNNRGIVNQMLGNLNDAFADYNRTIDLGLKNYHIFKNRGDVRLQSGDYAGAIEDYGLALEYEHHVEIYYLRGKIYYEMEETEKALADFNQCILEGYLSLEVCTLSGIIYGKMGDIENSIACFTKALAINPNYTFAYYNRAFAKYISSDYSGALADCEKLLSIDSQYTNAQVLKAEVIKKMK